MSRHILSLEFLPVTQPGIFSVLDTSQYTPAIPVKCPVLQITVPGFDTPVNLSVEEGFLLNLNACQLGLQTQNCEDVLDTLPDGIYSVQYSVSPNDKVWVEYAVLRAVQLENCLDKLRCELGLGACEPSTDQKDALREIYLIEGYLKAAKAKVGYCGQDEDGMALYTYAKRLVERLAKKYCTTC